MPSNPKYEKLNKYCVVQIGDQTFQTEPQADSPECASWGVFHNFDLARAYEHKDREDILVSVFIQWKLSNELVGEVRLPLELHKDVPRRFAVEHWYSLGSGRGEVGLIMGVTDPKTNQRRFAKGEDLEQKGADEIYLEANEIAKENKVALERMVRVAEQTRDIGAHTITELVHQGEQIKQAQEDVDTINEQITIGERKLRSIESCCGTLRNCCTSSGKKKKHAEDPVAKAEERKVLREKAKQAAESKKHERQVNQQYRKPASVDTAVLVGAVSAAPDSQLTSQELEFKGHLKDIDDQLNHVENLVHDMKQIAEEMGKELDVQIDDLDKLKANTEVEAVRLKKVTDKTKRLI